jgi:hypothetical protein
MYASRLTAEDEALPPELFRPVEADALRVLIARREAVDDMFGDDELSRTVANEIDQQRAVYAEARFAGIIDREEEEEAISELDISEDELTTSLLRLRAEMRTEFGLDPSTPSSDDSDQGRPAPAVPARIPIATRARTDLLDQARLDRERSLNPFRTTASGGPAEQKRHREARLLEEQMADTVDVTGVP